MSNQLTVELPSESLFSPGILVPPGIYRLIGSNREIRLDHEDYLPASLNGQVACYIQVKHSWGENHRTDKNQSRI